jgi:hypothetical protein
MNECKKKKETGDLFPYLIRRLYHGLLDVINHALKYEIGLPTYKFRNGYRIC